MKYIEVGKIVGTFGIKGELKVKSDSDFIKERFSKGNHLLIMQGEKTKEVTISSSRIHKGMVIVTINSLNDINQVLPFVGLSLYIDKGSLSKLPEDEYYVDDLIGRAVYNTIGEYLGKVHDIMDLPKNSILEVIDSNNKKILVPFINEFIERVEIDKIIIKEIEGMR